MGRLAPGLVRMTMSRRKSEPRLVCVFGLCFGQKEERPDRLIEFVGQIARIFGHAHHLEFTAGFRRPAEVFADRIFLPEKLARERLVDHCHVPRGRRILFGDAAPSDDRSPDHVEVSRRNPIPRSEVVVPGTRRRMAVHPNT